MIVLDKKYVFHIPLYKFENNDFVLIDINNILDDLINQLNQNGYDSFYIMNGKGYYKSQAFDELLITVFISQEQLKIKNQEFPDSIFKNWFKRNNNILKQEAFAYEYENNMFIWELNEN